MTAVQRLDEELRLALTDALRTIARHRPFQEVAEAYEAVSGKFVPLFEEIGEQWRAEETRRRVADGILRAAYSAGRPFEECESLLQRIFHLGFSDLHHKAHVLTTFCGYWSRHGRTRQVLPYLMPLEAELEAEYARTGEAVWANYLDDCQVILGRLDDGRDRDDHEQ